jgi:hypothetical protein
MVVCLSWQHLPANLLLPGCSVGRPAALSPALLPPTNSNYHLLAWPAAAAANTGGALAPCFLLAVRPPRQYACLLAYRLDEKLLSRPPLYYVLTRTNDECSMRERRDISYAASGQNCCRRRRHFWLHSEAAAGGKRGIISGNHGSRTTTTAGVEEGAAFWEKILV